jgi:hypothetical protein
MQLRTKLGSSAALAGLLLAGLATTASPALAAGSSGSTTVTFSVSSGGLAVSVPDSVNLGSGSPGSLITASLGAVKVTDQRANLVSTWTASASTSDFKTGSGTTAETIPSTDASYFTGVATSTGLSVTLGGLQLGAVNALPLPAAAAPALSVAALTAGVGNNTATWSPTLLIAVPSSAVGGTYTGTVTHSVA